MCIRRFYLICLLTLLILWLIIYFSMTDYMAKFKIRKLEWYFSKGSAYPTKTQQSLRLFYDQDQGDRIVEQLMYVPSNNYNSSAHPTKTHQPLTLFYDQDQGDRIVEQLMYVPSNYNNYMVKHKAKKLEWYFSEGSTYPTKTQEPLRLFYDQDQGDRIVEQLMYVPSNYNKSNVKNKTILMYFGFKEVDPIYVFDKCPVGACMLIANKEKIEVSDAIIFDEKISQLDYKRSPDQIWIMSVMESPFHSWEMHDVVDLFNWTATYRRNSDIVTAYDKWVYYDNKIKEKHQTTNYASNKTKKVAWYVSNCDARNNRLNYARELQNYISVHIYGDCGNLKCPRSNGSVCFKHLQQYKFYLAFENSNCHDYITEKLFTNALRNNILPIVMGAKKEDYIDVAPKNSFIHVNDFKSPKELADYLYFLDNNDDAYNAYFKWKGTGEIINNYFWCRLCAMLHSPIHRKSYKDINTWWRGPGVCYK